MSKDSQHSYQRVSVYGAGGGNFGWGDHRRICPGHATAGCYGPAASHRLRRRFPRGWRSPCLEPANLCAGLEVGMCCRAEQRSALEFLHFQVWHNNNC